MKLISAVTRGLKVPLSRGSPGLAETEVPVNSSCTD